MTSTGDDSHCSPGVPVSSAGDDSHCSPGVPVTSTADDSHCSSGVPVTSTGDDAHSFVLHVCLRLLLVMTYIHLSSTCACDFCS